MAYEYTRQSDIADDACVLMKPIIEKDEDGIKKTVGWKENEVFCRVSSIYMRESLKAYEAGIKAAWRLIVFAGDYDEETVVKFRGEIYNVYRNFYSGDDVELYCRKDEGTWQNGRI